MAVAARSIATLLDRQAIAHNLAGHAIGLDRRDLALIRRAYAPDARVAYGLFEGPAADFAAMICDFMAPMPPTIHRGSNLLIRVQGDRAVSESYVVACMRLADAQGQRDVLIQGRYLDHHLRSDQGWRIAERRYVFDWHGMQPADDPPLSANPTPAPTQTQPPSLRAEEIDVTLTEELRRGLEQALARNAIHDLIMMQARGVDRGDEALLAGLWHPGARVDLGFFNDSAEAFCPFIIAATAGMERMSHTVANEWIEVRGGEAVAESYVVAFTTFAEESGERVNEITAGRYLDRFACREGCWRFTERRFVKDFAMKQPAAAEGPGDLTAQLNLRGSRSQDDPVYELWRA